MEELSENRCSTENIQKMISEHFPVRAYHGKIMASQCDPSLYESREDDLDTVLVGKTWKDLGKDFLYRNEDDYVLMNGPSLLAFIGAWLWEAAEGLGETNKIRDSLVFHLSTYGSAKGGSSGLWARSFYALNQAQRNVIRMIVDCSAINRGNEDSLIVKALKNIDLSL